MDFKKTALNIGIPLLGIIVAGAIDKKFIPAESSYKKFGAPAMLVGGAVGAEYVKNGYAKLFLTGVAVYGGLKVVTSFASTMPALAAYTPTLGDVSFGETESQEQLFGQYDEDGEMIAGYDDEGYLSPVGEIGTQETVAIF